MRIIHRRNYALDQNHSLHLQRLSLFRRHPLDLGTKCTVLMTSRVSHAQKIGSSVPDLAADIIYLVVENALYHIIGADRVGILGGKIVVQKERSNQTPRSAPSRKPAASR